MALDDRTSQAQLTPEARRAHLRAFADRMLLKITAMDDPEDMPGVERAVRVAAVIERVYSRCDRAERQTRIEAPDLFKAEAECATHQVAAIEARVSLANTLKWGEERRLALGAWYDAAQSATQDKTPAPQIVASPERPEPVNNATPEALPETDTGPNISPNTGNVTYTDYTDDILAARASLAFRNRPPKPPP